MITLANPWLCASSSTRLCLCSTVNSFCIHHRHLICSLLLVNQCSFVLVNHCSFVMFGAIISSWFDCLLVTRTAACHHNVHLWCSLLNSHCVQCYHLILIWLSLGHQWRIITAFIHDIHLCSLLLPHPSLIVGHQNSGMASRCPLVTFTCEQPVFTAITSSWFDFLLVTSGMSSQSCSLMTFTFE